MTIEEIYNMIKVLRGSVVGFNINPDVAAGPWHSMLHGYTKNDVWNAAKRIMGNSCTVPTVQAIKSMCDTSRKQERYAQAMAEASGQYKRAAQSFDDVPGRNRFEKIRWVKADQAAKKWRAGETDNDVYNQCLIEAYDLGVETGQNEFIFSGVQYESIDRARIENAFGDIGNLPFEK
jgi:hypothetical protein